MSLHDEAQAAMDACKAVQKAALTERHALLQAGWPVDNGFLRLLDRIATEMADGFEAFRRQMLEDQAEGKVE